MLIPTLEPVEEQSNPRLLMLAVLEERLLMEEQLVGVEGGLEITRVCTVNITGHPTTVSHPTSHPSIITMSTRSNYRYFESNSYVHNIQKEW